MAPLRLVCWVFAVLLAQYLFLHAAKQYFSEALTYESNLAGNSSQFVRARADAAEAARLNPQNGYAGYQLALNDFMLDHFEPAVAEATNILPLMPHRANLLRIRGQSYYNMQRFGEAADDLTTYFRIVPEPKSNPGILMKVTGTALFQARRAGEAALWLDRSAIVPETLADAHRIKISSSLLLNDVEMSANSVLALFSRRAGETMNGLEILKNAMLMNRVQLLVNVMEHAYGCYPGEPALVQTLAAAYIRGNNATAAIKALREGLQQQPTDVDLHFMLADLLFQQGQYGEAEEHYNRVLQLQPNSRYRADIERRKAEIH